MKRRRRDGGVVQPVNMCQLLTRCWLVPYEEASVSVSLTLAATLHSLLLSPFSAVYQCFADKKSILNIFITNTKWNL